MTKTVILPLEVRVTPETKVQKYCLYNLGLNIRVAKAYQNKEGGYNVPIYLVLSKFNNTIRLYLGEFVLDKKLRILKRVKKKEIDEKLKQYAIM